MLYEIQMIDYFDFVAKTDFVFDPSGVKNIIRNIELHDYPIRSIVLPAELIRDFADDFAKAGYNLKPERTVIYAEDFEEIKERL